MSAIHFKATTTATPEQYIAGLTDFGPGRAKLFGNSADDQLKVHSESAHHADVTEGSGGTWERLAYDWSDPHRVVARTTDSNAWGGHSGHTYTFTQRPDGTTEIDYVVVREGPQSSRQAAAVDRPYTRWALRSLASVLASYFQIGSYSFAAGSTTYPFAQTPAPNGSP
jgi:hypothetical protein